MVEGNDMSMDDANWDSRTEKIQAFIKQYGKELRTDEDQAESLQIINTQMKRGGRRMEQRKKYWNAILLEGRNLPHWPIKKGKESTLPQNVQDALGEITGFVGTAYAQFWNDNPIVQMVETVSDRNKDLGGSPHPDADHFIKSKMLAVRQRLTKHYNNDRWNGEYSLDSVEDDDGNDVLIGLGITAPPQEPATTEGDSSEASN